MLKVNNNQSITNLVLTLILLLSGSLAARREARVTEIICEEVAEGSPAARQGSMRRRYADVAALIASVAGGLATGVSVHYLGCTDGQALAGGFVGAAAAGLATYVYINDQAEEAEATASAQAVAQAEEELKRTTQAFEIFLAEPNRLQALDHKKISGLAKMAYDCATSGENTLTSEKKTLYLEATVCFTLEYYKTPWARKFAPWNRCFADDSLVDEKLNQLQACAGVNPLSIKAYKETLFQLRIDYGEALLSELQADLALAERLNQSSPQLVLAEASALYNGCCPLLELKSLMRSTQDQQAALRTGLQNLVTNIQEMFPPNGDANKTSSSLSDRACTLQQRAGAFIQHSQQVLTQALLAVTGHPDYQRQAELKEHNENARRTHKEISSLKTQVASLQSSVQSAERSAQQAEAAARETERQYKNNEYNKYIHELAAGRNPSSPPFLPSY